jgi:GTPase SAR1 family protein
MISLRVSSAAGQELYYSTHQFFLSERSLFLLVTDVSKPLEFSRLDFWLESIRSRTKSAQVIIVGTHIDDKVHLSLSFALFAFVARSS